MRLDKFVSVCLSISRDDARKVIKNKEIYVNDKIINKISFIVNESKDIIKKDDEVLVYEEFIYLMMNKPSGYLSATVDKNKTVLDLIDEYKTYNLAITGRLDIDTVGLLLITNDGELIHNLTKPKANIYKKYYVEVDGKFKVGDIQLFLDGLNISDGKGNSFLTLPARLEIIDGRRAYISIKEGKFHQIKYMCKKIGLNVTYLKRLEIGPLVLDDNLKEGEYRKLENSEIDLLKSFTKTRQ